VTHHKGIRAVVATVAPAVVAVLLLVGCGSGAGQSLRAGAGTTTTPPPTAFTAPTTSSPIVPPVASAPATTTIVKGGTVTSPRPSPTTIKPVAAITRPPVQGVVQLTSADANGTFAVARGQSVQLTLSDQAMQWSPVTVDPTGLLRSDPAPPPPAHGQLMLWTATGAGTVKLSAVGTAYCAAGTACPMFARLFDVILVIS
jgi:hypothetical protein